MGKKYGVCKDSRSTTSCNKNAYKVRNPENVQKLSADDNKINYEKSQKKAIKVR